MPTLTTLTTLNAYEARLNANPAVTRWSTLLIDARGAFHCTLECSGRLRLLANSQAPVTISAIELWGWVTTVWLKKVGIKPMQIYPGSPWENGYNERFNGTLRKEVLNAEWFHTTPHGKPRSLSMFGSGNTTRSDLTMPWPWNHPSQKPY